MPFTPSHVAAALPFLRTPLMPAAVAIGTMAPDVPYFVPLGVPRELSHSWLGIVTIDLAVGSALFVAWIWLIRAPIVDALPNVIRSRLPPRRPGEWRAADVPLVRGVILLVASVVVGAVTHLVWDSFTHEGWLVDRLGILQTELGPLALYTWLQHSSTIIGLLVLLIWIVVWMRRTAARSETTVLSSRERITAWVVVIAAFGIAGLAVWVPGITSGTRPLDPELVFLVARVSIGVAGALALLGCLVWQIPRRYRVALRPSLSTES